MSVRSADATIKGYYYQFNKTIEELLDLMSLDATVLIEGVEDVDVNTLSGVDYVQCKYYSSSTLGYSSIGEAIILMLDNYRKKHPLPTGLKYKLYGYFKNETTSRTVSYNIDELKGILTYSENKVKKEYHIDNSITDTVLDGFLSNFSVIVGKEFNLHRSEIIHKIKSQFNCSDFDAENHYYNNALRVILDKAINKKEADRIISKKDFLKKIDTSTVLFFEWFKKYKDGSQYITLLKKQFKSLNLFSYGKDRMIVLGKHLDFTDRALPLDAFIENLIEKFYKISKVTYTTKPLTIVVDLSNPDLIALKTSLLLKGIKINDGWETILFSGDFFCEDPIINKNASGNIIKASYSVRLISYDTFQSNFSNISKKFSILYISEEAFIIPKTLYNQVVEVKYLNKLQEIYSIL